MKILVKKKSATPEKPLRKTITLDKIKQQITGQSSLLFKLLISGLENYFENVSSLSI